MEREEELKDRKEGRLRIDDPISDIRLQRSAEGEGGGDEKEKEKGGRGGDKTEEGGEEEGVKILLLLI